MDSAATVPVGLGGDEETQLSFDGDVLSNDSSQRQEESDGSRSTGWSLFRKHRRCSASNSVIAYSILRDQSEYRELGGEVFDQQHPVRTQNRLVRRLERLGLQVVMPAKPTLAPASRGA